MNSRMLVAVWLFLLTTMQAWGGRVAVFATFAAEEADTTSHLSEVLAEARRLSHEGKLGLAIEKGTAALQEAQKRFGTRSTQYAQALADVAGFYSRSGRYADALQMGTEALNLRRELLGEHHIDYANSLNNVARYYSYLGQPMEAVRMGRKAMELKEELIGKENANYAKSVSNLAGYFSRLGNYDEAISLGQQALAIRERTLGKNDPDYIESLNNLAKYYYFKANYAEAIRLEEQALALLFPSSVPYVAVPQQPTPPTSTDQHPTPIYATMLSNLADFYLKTGRRDDAMRCGEEALRIRKELLGEHHPDYAESLTNLAAYHFERGQHAEAIDQQRKALAVELQVLGPEHPSYAQGLCRMAVFFLANEQPDSAEAYAYKATGRYTNVILNTFADLTSSERDIYWQKVKPWFSNTLLQMAAKSPTSQMISSAYNGTLLAKGLLLKSEQEMVNMLMESGDETAVSDYKSLQASRTLLLNQFELPKSQRTLNTDSLQAVITRQERRLVRRSKTYGNFTRQLRIEWQHIAAALGPQDVAVEFVRYRSQDDGTGRYAALVVGPRWRHPQFIPLMDDSQLRAIGAKEVYTTPKLSALVWQPLTDYLKKARRVFFAPAGDLYNIAIESLPLWKGDDDEVMSDRWQLYRLSSTRELVLNTPQRRAKGQRPASAMVIGGITYDSRAEAMPQLTQSPTQTTPTNTQETLAGKNGELADVLLSPTTDDAMEEVPFENEGHNGLKYLPGTKREAEEIVGVLRADSIPTVLCMAETATEQTLKALSGHAPSLLHIATHGFYWTEDDIKATAIDERLQFLSSDAFKGDNDKALTRSGLFFAGANRALLGWAGARQGGNNGVLTAKEISLLDLRGLDMLVFSACQTGLGQVTGDGVFGLQRGFKKAGARTLLMSLWKVDDTATRLLMGLFYKNLTEGKTKHEALRLAQHELRTMQEVPTNRRGRHAISSRAKRARKKAARRPYEDPYYWAAFILLDAIDGRP